MAHTPTRHGVRSGRNCKALSLCPSLPAHSFPPPFSCTSSMLALKKIAWPMFKRPYAILTFSQIEMVEEWIYASRHKRILFPPDTKNKVVLECHHYMPDSLRSNALRKKIHGRVDAMVKKRSPAEEKNWEMWISARKMFIGGVDTSLSEIDVHDFFIQWGEIIGCFLVRRAPNAPHQRFGFIFFNDPDVVDQILKTGPRHWGYHSNRCCYFDCRSTRGKLTGFYM